MMTKLGTTSWGDPVHQITLASDALSVSLLSFGAALQDVRLKGVPHSLTLGTRDLAAYEAGMQYSGTIMGPVANRIGGASAVIDGQEYAFDRNFLDQHTLHSGTAATHCQVWEVMDHGKDHATLHLQLDAGIGGFPGNREITARFALNDSTLTLSLAAKTDAPTLINLANHSYWNLGPDPTTLGHSLQVFADHYLPTAQPSTLPLGDITDVTGTRFDYRKMRAIEAGAEGLIDNNFCLSNARAKIRHVATLVGPTGVQMRMATTEPGLQVFDGHGLDTPGVSDMDDKTILPYAGLAMEPQFWPDATNNDTFPSIILRPDEPWEQITRWEFSA